MSPTPSMISRRLVLATTMATGATLAVGDVPTADVRPTPQPSTAYEVEPAAGTRDLRMHAINTVDGPAVEAPRDRVRRWSGLLHLSRAGWGA